MTASHHIPLSERLKKAEYYARELSEHLRQSYLPRLGDLRSASKVFDEIEVSDQQMLDRMQNVLQADEFAGEVYAKLNTHLKIIRDEMQQFVDGGETGIELNDLTTS
ncbi:MAG: hypothetical protein MK110_16610 [Fuerstiella sp.]|nr:hypothetical protein [Fuerstiella sp.]